MARNTTTRPPGSNTKSVTPALPKADTKPVTCSNCSGTLELVGNRMFMMYKRAHLPQPRAEAWVCTHCGWVEGDPQFQALLEKRINHR